jgi:hypothetical protein
MKKLNFKKFQKVKYEDNNPITGFAIPQFMEQFNDTFYKSAYKIFEQFLKKNSIHKKWMFFSDYVISDQNKSNDVITICIIPYFISLDKLQAIINTVRPKDLKHTRTIGYEFIELITKMPILFISILLDKKRKLDFIDERKTLNILIDGAINMLSHWIQTTPENKSIYEKEICDFKIIKQELNKKSPNLKLIRDIIITANIIAFLMSEHLKVLKNTQVIGWFSDRDKILDFKNQHIKNPIIGSFIENYLHILLENQSIQNRPNLFFGLPERSGKVWYDGCNRLCDYICGTLADLNLQENYTTHEKFSFLLEKLICSSDQFLIFDIKMNKKEIAVRRITIGSRATGK